MTASCLQGEKIESGAIGFGGDDVTLPARGEGSCYRLHGLRRELVGCSFATLCLGGEGHSRLSQFSPRSPGVGPFGSPNVLNRQAFASMRQI